MRDIVDRQGCETHITTAKANMYFTDALYMTVKVPHVCRNFVWELASASRVRL